MNGMKSSGILFVIGAVLLLGAGIVRADTRVGDTYNLAKKLQLVALLFMGPLLFRLFVAALFT